MKKTKSILSLVLVLVFLFSVPIVSKATIYEGYVGGNYYKCTVTGSSSYIYSKIKYDEGAQLKVEVRPFVKYVYYGEHIDLGRFYDYKTANSSTITYNKTYAQFSGLYNPSLPANGYFSDCSYDSYIGGTKYLNGALEVF